MHGKCLIMLVISSGLIQLYDWFWLGEYHYKGFWLGKYLEDLIAQGRPHNPCRSKNYASVSL